MSLGQYKIDQTTEEDYVSCIRDGDKAEAWISVLQDEKPRFCREGVFCPPYRAPPLRPDALSTSY